MRLQLRLNLVTLRKPIMTSNRFLEHPDISLALRTGYPAQIKLVKPVDPATTVTDDEFAEIVAARLAKEAKQNA